MTLKPSLILAFVLLAFFEPGFAQLVKVDAFNPLKADTILLERNWRTRDRIILSELEFAAGDTVTPENLALSLKKIWNLQNFVSVAYRWDSLPDGRQALILTTRDALTIQPVFGGRIGPGGGDAYAPTLTLGVADRNFLGRNIGLEMRGQLSGVDPLFGEVKVLIPRQLLWKNMALTAGARSEQEHLASSVVANRLFVSIVNPFHIDYRYTFSPDIETGFLQHRRNPPTGHQIMELDTANWVVYQHNFWYVRITESLGTITHRRHQEEGFKISGMIGTGFHLNKQTVNYFEGSLKAEYHQLLNTRLQFSAKWEGYYSSSGYPLLWTRFNSGDIRGIHYGALTGPLMQLASTGLYYTWINRDWLALEQSAFVQYASAMTKTGDWSSVKRQFAVGTGFHFTLPLFPAGSVLVSFSYSPKPWNKWFYLEL